MRTRTRVRPHAVAVVDHHLVGTDRYRIRYGRPTTPHTYVINVALPDGTTYDEVRAVYAQLEQALRYELNLAPETTRMTSNATRVEYATPHTPERLARLIEHVEQFTDALASQPASV